jgi:hypothetical protein
MTIGDDVMARHATLLGLANVHIRWLREQGVPTSAFHRHDVVVRADVHLIDGGRFIFADEAREETETTVALVFVAYDELGVPDDLVAWPPRTKVAVTWLGRRSYLGDAFGPRLGPHGGVVVHPDPLTWLRADRDGLVLVDPDLAREQLRHAGPFVVDDDLDLAQRLESALTLPSPEIIVISARQEAA